MKKLPIIRLQSGRHKRTQGGHPWIFSNEIVMDPAAKAMAAGTIVKFQAHDSASLGIGSYNPHSLIAGRIFSRSPLDVIDVEWITKRLQVALARREALIDTPFYRLVHAEADGLPGLIIDRFDSHFSVQLNTATMDRLAPEIEAALVALFDPETIVFHNESPVRKLEGLKCEVRVAKGKPKGPVKVQENGLTYFADIVEGQKTGWYYDQRDNHALVARFAKDKTVLDLYTHAGGFALLAAKAGATHITGVDSSESALELAAMAAKHNKLQTRCTWQRADVFDSLEAHKAAKETFDIVIADPPPFVKSRKDITAGTRGYRKLAMMAASVTAPEGLLYIASCSHNMSLEMFTAAVANGLADAKREGQILFTTFASPDHPLHPHLPESAYLKGVLIRLS